MARSLDMSHFPIVLCCVFIIIGAVKGTSSSEDGADRRCDVDKYYDEFTRNCEACSLLCEVARDTMKECEQKCRDYLAMVQQQTTTPVYRPRHGHHGGQGYGTGEAVRVDNVQISTQLSAINDSLRAIFYVISALTAVATATVTVVGGSYCLLQVRRKRLDEENYYSPPPHQSSIAVQVDPPEQENVRDHPEGGEEAAETNPSLPVQNASRCPSHSRLNVEDALRNQQAHDAGRRSSSESDV